jgi:uncharacterized membrane protein
MPNLIKKIFQLIALVGAVFLFVHSILYRGTIGTDRGLLSKDNLVEVSIVILVCLIIVLVKSYIDRRASKK